MPIECIGILKSGRTLAKTNAKTKLKVWNYIARYNQMWYLHQGRNRKKKKKRDTIILHGKIYLHVSNSGLGKCWK